MPKLSITYRENSEYLIENNVADRLALVKELSEGRTYSDSEILALELGVQQQTLAHRRELLSGSLTTVEAACLLRITRQTVHDRMNADALLAIMDKRRLRFPAWQFDADGPNGVIFGIAETLRALNISPLGKVSWMTLPNPYLGNRTPLQALKDGDIQQVMSEALCVGAV